jgi:hypothetical protein
MKRRNPWVLMPALVVSIYGIYLAAQWPLAGHHLFGYIGFNSKSVEAGESTIPGRFISDAYGYDGQFYFRMALDPLAGDERVHGIRFDHSALRQQRILLPALTWLFARGDPQLSAAVMLAINLLAVAGISLVAGALLQFHGISPWPALLFAFYPGFAISVERFLSEPLGGLLVLLSLLILAHKRIAWAGIVLALAVLARETALLAALATAGIWLLQTVLRFKTDRWRAPGLTFAGRPGCTAPGWGARYRLPGAEIFSAGQ